MFKRLLDNTARSFSATFFFISLVLTCSCGYVLAQQQTANWLLALENPSDPKYRLNRENEIAPFSRYDFSKIMRPQSEFIGFIEPNYQRLNVYFNSIKKSKNNPRLYFVNGATIVKGNRCDFSGTIKLTQIREYRSKHYGVDDEYKSKGIIKQGVTVGLFQFNEDPKQNHVGIFEGVMTVNWYLDRFRKLHYDDIEIGTDPYRNNQYVSTWTQYGKKTSKIANWGEYRIPYSGDLDIGAGEFSVNPKYLENGWRSYKTP